MYFSTHVNRVFDIAFKIINQDSRLPMNGWRLFLSGRRCYSLTNAGSVLKGDALADPLKGPAQPGEKHVPIVAPAGNIRGLYGKLLVSDAENGQRKR